MMEDGKRMSRLQNQPSGTLKAQKKGKITIPSSVTRSLFTALCLLSSVFCPPSSDSAFAARIGSISLQKSPGGDTVAIHADGPLTYEVFDLNAPPRLVLNMHGASLAHGMEPLRDQRPGVNSVFSSISDDDVRLEIGMDRALTYRIDEQGNNLLVHFAAIPRPDAHAGGTKVAAVLKDLDIHDRGTLTEIVLRGDHMDASHDAFVTNKGRTLILDFWGAVSKLPREHYDVSSQRVSGVTAGKTAGRVRLVVNLMPGASENYRIDVSKRQMTVRLGKIAAGGKAAVRVEDVRFQPDDRVAHLIIRTDATNPVVNVYKKKGNVVLDIRKASLAAGQERSQDVSDFPGPVRQVDAYRAGDQVRIVARLREKARVSTFQRGNVITVTLIPEDIAAARRGAKEGEKFAYTGRKVSFDFKDIDIRNALKMIAEMSDLNIIMTDDVSGKLTMRLVDVPWDQALDIILSARGLGKARSGNVMRIAPLKVLQDENAAKLKARKTTQNLEPLITEFISLSFASVDDVKAMLEGSKTAAATGGSAAGAPAAGAPSTATGEGFGLLSPRGSVLADARSNTLIVNDTQAAVNNIKRLIARIDQPVKQVLIEARIVEATDDFTRELGVSFGAQVQGSTANTTNRLGNVSNRTQPTATSAANPGSTAPIPGGFLVDLPAAVGTGAGGMIGFSVMALNSAFNLDLELSAAEADNKVKIVSSPRVVTTNQKTASINQGKDIPFQTSSANTGTNIEFKKANLGLEVTPQITADKRVLLHVLVTKDSPIGAGANPTIDTKKIETDIFMTNGETIVIGGIYTRDHEKATTGVPGLMNIPVLGWLFKKKKHIDNKTELLIFITPKILDTAPVRDAHLVQAN